MSQATDNYFLNPDFLIKGQALAKAALGTVDYARDRRVISPLADDHNYQDPSWLEIKVQSQLQKRRLYFALIFDQLQSWDIDCEVEALVNGSPVFSWPMFFRSPALRQAHAPGPGIVLDQPNDSINLPYWVDVQKGIVNGGILQEQIGWPGNENLTLLPLATCPQVQHVNSLWFQFAALEFGEPLTGEPPADPTPYVIYYTVTMPPTEINLFCDTIRLNLRQATFQVNVYQPRGDGGFLMGALACVSKRY